MTLTDTRTTEAVGDGEIQSETRPPASVGVPALARIGLPPAARRDFESILGAGDICDDPAIVSAYAWCYNGMRGDPPERLISAIKPIAVALPESTEEVQALVKACLRHGLKFRAHSTGVGSFPNVANNGTVVLDLRKMNRIVSIDARNQMAVIEPYVTAQQLMAETMKVGLTTHVIGAGWTHSPLASATSFMGVGPSGNHTGNNPRNMLGIEWVTPEGELVRLGAPGQSMPGQQPGWFAGEGPGPGFRGMIRGFIGGFGELGVFTRIGYKLHPWNGPAKLEHCGSNPQWGIRLSETMRLYHFVWSTWQEATEATFELLRANAATYICRFPADQTGWMLYPTNREFYDRWTSGDIAEMARNENRVSWTLLAVSESMAEAEWRERTIRRIATDTGGRLLPLEQEHAETIARNVVTSCYVPRIYRSAARGVFTSIGIMDSPGLLAPMMERVERLNRPYKEKYRTMVEGSPEAMWMWTSEGRQLWGENAINGDNENIKSWADMMAFSLDSIDENHRKPLGISPFIGTNDLMDTFLAFCNTSQWIRKLKVTFDPGFNSDGKAFPRGPLSGFRKIWPVARQVRRFAPILFRIGIRNKIRKASRAALKLAAEAKRGQ